MSERSKGEFRSSLLLVFLMYVIVTSVCWGWLGDALLGIGSILAWGVGDAFAAVIGKRFGKHQIKAKHIEGKKSLEGTLAMFAFSFLSVFAVLLIRGGLPIYVYCLVAIPTAIVSATIELFSMKGTDTIFCPLGAMASLIALLYLFGGIVV